MAYTTMVYAIIMGIIIMIYEATCFDLDLPMSYSTEEEASQFMEAFSSLDIDDVLNEGLGDAIAAFFRKIKELIQRFWNWLRGKDQENQAAVKKSEAESLRDHADAKKKAVEAVQKVAESEKELEKISDSKKEFDDKFNEVLSKISNSNEEADKKAAEKERAAKEHEANKARIEQSLKAAQAVHTKALQDALIAKKAKEKAERSEAARSKIIQVSDISALQALSKRVYEVNLNAVKKADVKGIITADMVSEELKNIKKISIQAGNAMDYLRPGIHFKEADAFGNAAHALFGTGRNENPKFISAGRHIVQLTVTALARIMLAANSEMSAVRRSLE